MYEYKVIEVAFKDSEAAFNELAKDGWRVVTVSPNIAKGMGLIATLEKKL